MNEDNEKEPEPLVERVGTRKLFNLTLVSSSLIFANFTDQSIQAGTYCQYSGYKWCSNLSGIFSLSSPEKSIGAR